MQPPEAEGLELQRDLVDRLGRRGRDDGVDVDVREQRDLLADLVGDLGWSERRTITSGWMPMPRSSLTECWVGLVLSSPVAARAGSSVTWTYSTFARPDVLAHLADGLEERQALDVADRAADLDDHDVRVARRARRA